MQKPFTMTRTFALVACVALPFPALAAVANTAVSDFPKQELGPGRELRPATELAVDDGTSAGQRSVAGSAHAVRFEAPGTNSYLTGIRLFASRYGYPAPPAENAYVWLCDSDFKAIAVFALPYSRFQRGTPQWVTVSTKPTLVPKRFFICVGFNPTATKGVYVHHDAAQSGNSFLGLPGTSPRPFQKGDWLLRPLLQEPKP